jgi:hypothetical protein
VLPINKTLLTVSLLAGMAGAAQAADPVSQQRIAELEARIKQLEAGSAQLQAQIAEASAATEAARAAIDELKNSQIAATDASTEAALEPTASAADANGNAFNPAISIILNGSYQHHSLNPDDYVRAGFAPVEGAGPETQGLSLGESEFTFSSNIDDKFYGQITLAFGDGDIGVEEAYIDTTSLPNGLSLRGGRFFSNIGYLNSHHAHTDNFFDRPLAYQSFLANQYGDDGVQLRWVAPTELFIELGAEVFAGNSYPAAASNGVGTQTLFAHVGGDVGTDNSWLAGLSVLDADAVDGEDGFSGDARLYIADATWKWAAQGNFKEGGITLRGEYIKEQRDGLYIDPQEPDLTQIWDGNREGAYVEGIYRFSKRWETGYRFDQLWADDSGPYASSFDPYRNSVMLTWRNSEFSLFRLQYSQDKPNADDTDNAVYLQFQTSLGAHGAHKF